MPMPAAMARAWRSPDTLFSPDKDVSRVRLVNAVQHFHGGGFARAVFADDAVNRAPFHAQVDARSGSHASKLLGQFAQFDCGCAGRHCPVSLIICLRESMLSLIR